MRSVLLLFLLDSLSFLPTSDSIHRDCEPISQICTSDGVTRSTYNEYEPRSMSMPRCVAFNASGFPLHVLETCTPVRHSFALELHSHTSTILTSQDIPRKLHLIRLYVGPSKLQLVEANTFATLTSLHILQISQTLISRILKNTFNGLQSLRILYLFDNKISEIEDGAFEDVRQIRGLDLAGNALTNLSEGYFEGLSDLDKLKLSRNRINTIAPETFQNLVSLRDLHLDNNDLTVVDASIFAKLSPIQVLNLTHNHIQVVEADAIKQMKHLRSLLLSENELLRSPIDLLEELAGNEKLTVLELHNNPYRCTCSVPLDQFPLLGNLSPSIWKQVQQGIICVHPPDLSGTPMFNSTVQFPCPPPLVKLSNEKKTLTPKGKWAFTCKVYWEEEPVVKWFLPGNVVLELPYPGDRQNGTIRFQAPRNISWTVEHIVKPEGWTVCYNNVRKNASQSQVNVTCHNFIGRTVSMVVGHVSENTWLGKEVACSANLSSSMVDIKQSVVFEDIPDYAIEGVDNNDYFIILDDGLPNTSKKYKLKLLIFIAASVAMVVTCSVVCALQMQQEQQEMNNQGRNDVSIHEYEDIDNNHKNGVERELNNQNRDRYDSTVHEYEDIDNNHQNGVQCRQPDDTAPEIKDDPFYAAAAEVSTYESADSHIIKKTNSFYNKEHHKSEESVTYAPKATPGPAAEV